MYEFYMHHHCVVLSCWLDELHQSRSHIRDAEVAQLAISPELEGFSIP
jgi:hypothetical protein